MEIKTLTIFDLDKVIQFEMGLFDRPFSHQQIYTALKESNVYEFIVDGKEVGICFLKFILEEAQLESIGIKREYQQHGYGRLFLEQIIKMCQEKNCTHILLEVSVLNLPAIKLYEYFNFRINRTRPLYYGTHDGYEMILQLKEEQ